MAAGLLVVALAAGAGANTIKLYDPGNRYSNGGPFDAHVLGPVPGGLVGSTITSGVDAGGISFVSFCLETTEYFYGWGVPYDFWIDTKAYRGGLSGGSPDPLDARTAYLYTQFRTDPDFHGDIDDATKQKALQAAIWYIEGEQASVSGLAKDFVDEAAAAVGKTWFGLGNVVVLNLYDSAHGQLQSQVAMVPEPGTLVLLGSGLLGLAALGWRRRKK
jgi:hypothetical protein